MLVKRYSRINRIYYEASIIINSDEIVNIYIEK